MIAEQRVGHLDQIARGLLVERAIAPERVWAHVGTYSLGLEPANCSVLGRAHDRGEGRLPFLGPGEARTTRIAVSAEEGS